MTEIPGLRMEGMLSVVMNLRIQQKTEVKNRNNSHLGKNVLITIIKKAGNCSSRRQKIYLTRKVVFS